MSTSGKLWALGLLLALTYTFMSHEVVWGMIALLAADEICDAIKRRK